ncbi:hypothetical protein CTI12_AA200360 [Artemisia annua]|uniref:Reverse transcriptase domain, Reverse transcriptase zinc-binding domain protein n=1 Tax=Artemisia annua TaxID=35608 RepID=A0A2U1P2Y0_ARTAN|nr:hypothetical protein CTI12_AA200360 [Artemisia annua]
MCNNGYGRLGYARVLVEMEACKGLPDSIEVVYKDAENNIKRRKSVKVEYPWKPMICEHCAVFGHSMHNCKVRPRTSDEIVQEQNRKNIDVEQMHKAKDDVKNGKVDLQNKDSEGFVEVRNRRHNGRGKYFQQKKQMFRPKENQSKAGDTNGTSRTPPSLEKVWRVSHDAIKEIHRSANKYATLASTEEQGIEEENLEQEAKTIVECFVLTKKKPTNAEYNKWTEGMREYFKYRWRIVNDSMDLNMDEEDIISNKKKQVRNNFGWTVDKIIVAASVYYLWQERNWRLFKDKCRTVEVVVNIIKDSVKTQLLTLKVRKTVKSQLIADRWRLYWATNGNFVAC